MTLDWDGQIRMDPSSPYAMQRLIGLKDAFDIAFACDTDHDRHGIVTPSARAAAAQPLPGGRDRLPVPQSAATGARTRRSARRVVSSAMIDRVAAQLGRKLYEVPVGFKWFVDGLLDGSLGLRRRGERRRVVPAPRRHGLDDGQGRHRRRRCSRRKSPRGPAAIPASSIASSRATSAMPVYERIDAPATPEQKAAAGEALAAAGPDHASWPANRSRASSRSAPATARHRRPEGRSPKAAGLPRARPAPRTSTRSTPRASAARIICALLREAQTIVDAALASATR